jgi:hypothetical protein
MSISKIIWQTHNHNFNNLPEEYKENVFLWKSRNLDWQYVYHNAEERKQFLVNNGFIKNLSGEDRYDHLHGITQSEIWRAAIIWKNGGSYADLDSIPVVPDCLNRAVIEADDLKMDYSIICTNDSQHKKIGSNNSNFIAPKGSNFLKSILDKFLKPLNLEDSSLTDEQKLSRAKFIINNLTFGAEVILRDDIAFTLNAIDHGDHLKPEEEIPLDRIIL